MQHVVGSRVAEVKIPEQCLIRSLRSSNERGPKAHQNISPFTMKQIFETAQN